MIVRTMLNSNGNSLKRCAFLIGYFFCVLPSRMSLPPPIQCRLRPAIRLNPAGDRASVDYYGRAVGDVVEYE